MQNKSIVFVLKHFPINGGVEKVSLNLAKQFVADGQTVSFFIMDGADVPSEVTDNYPTFLGEKKGPLGLLKSAIALKRWILENNANVAIGAKEQANLVTFIASIFCNKFQPIYTRHCAFDVSDQRLSVAGITFLYNLYGLSRGKVVAVSKALSEYIVRSVKLGRKKVTYCPNPVVDDHLLEMSKKNTEGFNHDNRYFCAVGRLCEQKGFDLLVEAYAKAYALDESIADLLIVGDGPDRELLAQQIEEVGLEGKIKLLGFNKNPYYIMAGAECFVLSSRHEGLPTVLIEALAVGTPVIATDCPTGPNEILVQGKFGKLVSVGDINALADSLLIANRGLPDIPHEAVQPYKHSASASAYYKVMETTA